MVKEFESIKKAFINECKKEISRKKTYKPGTIEGLKKDLEQWKKFIDKLTPILDSIIKRLEYDFDEQTNKELLEYLNPTIHKMIKEYFDK